MGQSGPNLSDGSVVRGFVSRCPGGATHWQALSTVPLQSINKVFYGPENKRDHRHRPQSYPNIPDKLPKGHEPSAELRVPVADIHPYQDCPTLVLLCESSLNRGTCGSCNSWRTPEKQRRDWQRALWVGRSWALCDGWMEGMDYPGNLDLNLLPVAVRGSRTQAADS